MARITYGPNLVFGDSERKPIKRFPPGKVRIKFRPEEFAIGYVKTENGIQMFYIAEEDGFWVPSIPIAKNERFN